jgi:Amt family ammonium transporter
MPDICNREDFPFAGIGMTPHAYRALGTLSVGAFVFGATFAVWLIHKACFSLRVKEDEELKGHDIGEHGQDAIG